MTRLQKKCFLFSVGMHGLLLVILVGSSAFRDKPEAQNLHILTMIPANILDEPGVGGGSPAPAAAPQTPQPVQPAQPIQPAQPVQHAVQTPQPVPPQPVARQKPIEPIEPVETPKVRRVEKEPTESASIPKKVSAKPPHEIHPDFTPAKSGTPESEASESAASQRARDRRLRRQIAQSLAALATGVKTSGAKGTAVDMPGEGGGEAFADYKSVIYSYYLHAWITPDSVVNKLASTDVKIVVARDGTILSAEIINKSGESPLDKSVERVLRAVTKLPPFPATARDEQRSFVIRFNLESKEASG